VIDGLGFAPPSARSEDQSASAKRILGHVAADETGDAGDE
jgi:hypothetical protein